jgi:lactate permease
MLFIYRYLRKETDTKPDSSGWILFLAIMLPYVATSWFFKELTGIIAAAVMAIFSYFFLFKIKNINLKPWLPYALLILLLLLPKIISPLGDLLTHKFSYKNVLGTNVSTSIQPFRSPMIPFLIASAFALWKVRNFKVDVGPVFSKTLSVFLILFPSLAITELMMNSGNNNEIPSMVNSMAGVFVKAGNVYPVFAPIIGVLGAFITGSTTVSNVIFGPLQYNAAQALSLPVNSVLGMQLAGASLGNAICLFNIIAAAAVVGVEKYNAILKKNILPVILASLGIALTGYLIILFTG